MYGERMAALPASAFGWQAVVVGSGDEVCSRCIAAARQVLYRLQRFESLPVRQLPRQTRLEAYGVTPHLASHWPWAQRRRPRQGRAGVNRQNAASAKVFATEADGTSLSSLHSASLAPFIG